MSGSHRASTIKSPVFTCPDLLQLVEIRSLPPSAVLGAQGAQGNPQPMTSHFSQTTRLFRAHHSSVDKKPGFIKAAVAYLDVMQFDWNGMSWIGGYLGPPRNPKHHTAAEVQFRQMTSGPVQTCENGTFFQISFYRPRRHVIWLKLDVMCWGMPWPSAPPCALLGTQGA